MALSFQPVTLDTDSPDREATLVFRDGRLLAVLSCLSDIHDEAGQWFLETSFAAMPERQPTTFPDLDRFETWLRDRAGAGRDA